VGDGKGGRFKNAKYELAFLNLDLSRSPLVLNESHSSVKNIRYE
jgi:hypothetical protein